MARQPEHLAEQLRTLGRYLAALRQAAGLCQVDIARAVPCHRTTVSHAEAGSQLPDVYFWEIADRIVGANGVLIARYNQLMKAKAAHFAEQQAERRSRAQATALLLKATTSLDFEQIPHGVSEVYSENQMCEQRGAHTSHEVPFDPMKRRTLLGWGLGVTAGSSLGRVPGGQLDDGASSHPGPYPKQHPVLTSIRSSTFSK